MQPCFIIQVFFQWSNFRLGHKSANDTSWTLDCYVKQINSFILKLHRVIHIPLYWDYCYIESLSLILTYIIQIALRWIYQQGSIPIVKSFNKERMKQNIEIFDWELNQEELDKINQIPQCRLLKAEMFVSDNGPYKSLEELWDGDPWANSCLNNRWDQCMCMCWINYCLNSLCKWNFNFD